MVGRLIAQLGAEGYEPVLFVTPTAHMPDHHTLAVARAGSSVAEQTLPDAAADALIRAMDVVDDPYQAQP